MSNLNISIIIGTSREGRMSERVAKVLQSVGGTLEGINLTLVDPREFNLPLDGSSPEFKDPAYTKIVEESDAFFIVLPEYNHGYSGSLKRLLDSEYDLYLHKPVALAGVSKGPWGGIRAVESILPVIRGLRMIACTSDVYFPMVGELVDEKGNLLNKAHEKSILKTYEELIFLARALKEGRAK